MLILKKIYPFLLSSPCVHLICALVNLREILTLVIVSFYNLFFERENLKKSLIY